MIMNLFELIFFIEHKYKSVPVDIFCKKKNGLAKMGKYENYYEYLA